MKMNIGHWVLRDHQLYRVMHYHPEINTQKLLRTPQGRLRHWKTREAAQAVADKLNATCPCQGCISFRASKLSDTPTPT